MTSKVFYSKINGKYRPYLELVFKNNGTGKESQRVFAMVDSGADHTVIPFSLGSFIGFNAPTEQEVLASVSGVGGNLSYLERRCQIQLFDNTNKEIITFDETVWWIYPDDQARLQIKQLFEKYQNFERLKGQCIPETDLNNYFGLEMRNVINEINTINNRFESMILLGRPFFNNFEYVKFCHKDRDNEEQCYFTYKLLENKVIEKKPNLSLAQLAGAVK